MSVNVLSTVMIISFIIVLALLLILLAIHSIVLIQQQSSLCRVSYKLSMCLTMRSLPDSHRHHYLLPSLPLPPSIQRPSQSLPLYLEFLQHHLLMGASHIFLAANHAWGGAIMNKMQRILRSFIEDGSVSITSYADDGVDYLYSTRGMSFERDNLKIFQVLSKPQLNGNTAFFTLKLPLRTMHSTLCIHLLCTKTIPKCAVL